MTLKLRDRWIWDSWFARNGSEIHTFYLQAERRLGDPEKRHWNVSVGHAKTRDFQTWEVLPNALVPSTEPERFDSLTTWTGCVVSHDDHWEMFYTGTSRVENGLVQRICRARSKDLERWYKQPGCDTPRHDAYWYEELDLASWHDQSWRDPWLVHDAADGLWHMFITCRVKGGAPDGRGAIGHAISPDLIRWTTVAPVLAPGDYGEMEVPQVFRLDRRWYLLCSVSARFHSARNRNRPGPRPRTGAIYYVSDSLEGPWRTFDDPFLHGDAQGSLYGGRMIEIPGAGPHYVAFRNMGHDGQFVGELGAPLPIRILPDGQLCIVPSA